MNINLIRFLDRRLGLPIVKLLSYINKRSDINLNPRKIIILKFWGIGTIIQSSSLLKAIRKNWPGAEIIFITLNNNKELYNNSKLFNKIIYLNVKNVFTVVTGTIRVIKFLRNNNSDLIIDLEPLSNYTAIIAYLSKSKKKIGFKMAIGIRHKLYDEAVDYEDGEHINDKFLNFAKYLKIGYDNNLVEPVVSPIDKKNIINLLNRKKIKDFVIFNINSSDLIIERRYPRERFAKLADYVIDKYKRDIIFTGVSNQSEYVKSCIEMIKNKDKTHNFCGKSLPELIYLISLCKLIVTNDSGPLHIAVSTSTPSVSFFGPETPRLYGPRGKIHKVLYKPPKCSPCIDVYKGKKVYCSINQKCLRNIKIGEVKRLIDKQLFSE